MSQDLLERVMGIAVCRGFALHTARPRLQRSALAAKNSIPYCFLYAATLSGSIPLQKLTQIKKQIAEAICLWSG